MITFITAKLMILGTLLGTVLPDTLNGTAALTGNAALVGLVIRGLITWATQKKETIIKDAIVDITSILQAMNNILASTKASRVTVHKVHNSGAIPRPGIQLYDTVIYEQVQKIDTEKESWEKRSLTNDLTQMVTQLALSKEYTLRYNDLPSGTVLADLGAKDNLIESRLYEIYSEDSAYYYLKLDFIVESNMNPVEREIIRVSVNKIKSLFDINHKRIKTYKLN